MLKFCLFVWLIINQCIYFQSLLMQVFRIQISNYIFLHKIFLKIKRVSTDLGTFGVPIYFFSISRILRNHKNNTIHRHGFSFQTQRCWMNFHTPHIWHKRSFIFVCDFTHILFSLKIVHLWSSGFAINDRHVPGNDLINKWDTSFQWHLIMFHLRKFPSEHYFWFVHCFVIVILSF